MVQAGNVNYAGEADLPETVAVFPLAGALLLPGGQMPLNIFEPRYLAMVDDALTGGRIIGMIQPRLDGARTASGDPELCRVGCLGRITSLTETGDGRYIINLHGIARFRVIEELEVRTPYRVCRLAAFVADLDLSRGAGDVNRDGLLAAFRLYLESNQLEADWESVTKASNETLVNALCMMSPYGAPGGAGPQDPRRDLDRHYRDRRRPRQVRRRRRADAAIGAASPSGRGRSPTVDIFLMP